MALSTSILDGGQFELAETWDTSTAPGSGDTFLISDGDTVIYDSEVSNGDGFGDSTIDGVLEHSAPMNMNGRLYLRKGGLHQKPGSEILFKGTTGNEHGIYMYGNSGDGAFHIAEGTDGMFSTKLNEGKAAGSTDLDVDTGMASRFAIGDWIAVWENNGKSTKGSTGDQDAIHFCDEGFWIHDIDGDTIYPREFVGPEDVTITAADTTTLTLSNAKKFSVGQKVIFGTGSNRNVTSITAVNYSANQVTIGDSVGSTTVVGETIYYTGTAKNHVDNSKVRKVATTVTTAASGGTSQIIVGSAVGFAVDDEIWIEARSECGASGGTPDTDDISYWTYNARHTISSLDTGTGEINLDSALPYNVVQGALVTRLTRDIIIGAQTFGTDRPYLYYQHTDDFFTRKVILKDVWFRGIGNSNNNTYSGFAIRGYFSTNDGASGDGGDVNGDAWTQNTESLPVDVNCEYIKDDRQPYIEGCVAIFSQTRDHSGLWLWDAYHTKMRCMVVGRARDGIHLYNDPSQACYNTISFENRYHGIRNYLSQWNTETAYIYCSRNERGLRFNTCFSGGMGAHHIINDANSHYQMWLYAQGPASGQFWNIRCTGGRYGVLLERCAGDVVFHRSEVKPATAYAVSSTYMSNAGSSWGGHMGYFGLHHQRYVNLEKDFEYDGWEARSYHCLITWDADEDAYLFRRRSDSSGYPVLCDSFYVPADTTCWIRIEAKAAAGFNGSYPYAYAHSGRHGQTMAYSRVSQTGTPDWQSMVGGGQEDSIFTSSFDTNYEQKDFTIQPVGFGRFIQAGIVSHHNSASEGFYVKPIMVTFDKPAPMREMITINQKKTGTGLIRIAAGPSDKIVRIGGGVI